MNISKGLGVLLKEQSISRSRLARTLGVHTSTVTNWLDGKDPKAENLKDICDLFNTDIEFLQTGEQKKTPSEDGALTETQKKIIDRYGKLSPENLKIALAQLEVLIDLQEKKDDN